MFCLFLWPSCWKPAEKLRGRLKLLLRALELALKLGDRRHRAGRAALRWERSSGAHPGRDFDGASHGTARTLLRPDNQSVHYKLHTQCTALFIVIYNFFLHALDRAKNFKDHFQKSYQTRIHECTEHSDRPKCEIGWNCNDRQFELCTVAKLRFGNALKIRANVDWLIN